MTGEAQYTDDVPVQNCLHAALVTSTVPHAHLINVDATSALAMPGIIGFYCHKDVPGSNAIGIVVQDEEVFASKTVTCVGQVCLQFIHSPSDVYSRSMFADLRVMKISYML